MIKTGIYLDPRYGSEFLEDIRQIPELNLIGIYTPEQLHINYPDLRKYDNPEALIKEVDAVIAFAPMSQPENVEYVIKNFKHVLFEPTHEYKNENLNKLSKYVEEANVKVMAGFQHYYNNTFISAKPFIKNPRFIQSKNFRCFDNTTLDYPILLNMLVVDLDIILSIIKTDIKHLSANYSSLKGKDPDIINVNIEFLNGASAQLTVGRIATDNSHEISFYCENDYTNLDLIRDKAWLVKKRENNYLKNLFQQNIGDLIVEPIPIKKSNFISNELNAFAKSIIFDKLPEFSIDSLVRTYEVLSKIIDKLKISHK